MYSNMGRPSVDPVLLIKMLLLGFPYGIDSERKLEKEVQVNIAFRWFLGIDLDEAVPDHSTISQTRRRKWRGTGIFEDIFTEVVQKCIAAGLVDGSLILSDSTHVKANVNDKRKAFVTVEVKPRDYIKKLDALCEQEDLKKRESSIAKGLQKRGYQTTQKAKTKRVEKNGTDPDCGILSRPGKPEGFYYLSHQSVDGKSGIITDVYVTQANIQDFECYVDRLKHQLGKYRFATKEVGLDGGYDYEEVLKELYDLGIKVYVPPREMERLTSDRIYPPSVFQYDSERDVYICPNACDLKYSSVNKSERKKVYRASQRDCRCCPLRENCIGGKQKCRTIKMSFFKEALDSQYALYATARYFEVQRKRRIYCEGNFGLQKENYNLRQTRKRGNEAVTEHCLCSALALNLKRLVKYLKQPVGSYLFFRNILCCSF